MAFLPQDEAFAQRIERGADVPMTRVSFEMPTALFDSIQQEEVEEAARTGRKADVQTALAAKLAGCVTWERRAVGTALAHAWEPFRAAPFGTDGRSDRRYLRVAEATARLLRLLGFPHDAARVEQDARQTLTSVKQDRSTRCKTCGWLTCQCKEGV